MTIAELLVGLTMITRPKNHSWN